MQAYTIQEVAGLTPGTSLKNLTAHGIRKGAANAVSTGCVAGPSIMAICLRAEWSIGAVLSRYFRFEASGDAFVGRCATLMDPCSSAFAALPPHFDPARRTEADSALIEVALVVSGFVVAPARSQVSQLLFVCAGTVWILPNQFFPRRHHAQAGLGALLGHADRKEGCERSHLACPVPVLPGHRCSSQPTSDIPCPPVSPVPPAPPAPPARPPA
eukprot:SAG22_NODE_622_length_8493_cov_196.309864_1_plen_213_part_10